MNPHYTLHRNRNSTRQLLAYTLTSLSRHSREIRVRFTGNHYSSRVYRHSFRIASTAASFQSHGSLQLSIEAKKGIHKVPLFEVAKGFITGGSTPFVAFSGFTSCSSHCGSSTAICSWVTPVLVDNQSPNAGQSDRCKSAKYWMITFALCSISFGIHNCAEFEFRWVVKGVLQ